MLTRLTCLCADIFSMQSTENTLFVRRECLASVGSFVLLLIHCLAHITTGDFNQDSNPRFLGLFYEVLMTYTELLFLCDSDIIPQDNKSFVICGVYWSPIGDLTDWEKAVVPGQTSCNSIWQNACSIGAADQLQEQHLSYGNNADA